MRQHMWDSCIKPLPSLLLVVVLSGCSGGGGDSSTSSSPAPAPTPVSFIDTVSSMQPNPLIVQSSFIAAGQGFRVLPRSTFPGTFRFGVLTEGSNNPRSLTFVTSNTPGSRICTDSITLPDGRKIDMTQEQVDRVFWPNRTSPEYLVLSTCGSTGGSAVMLFPVSLSKGNLTKASCESQPDGFFSLLGGCIYRFPSSGSGVNQSNPITQGYYLFTIANFENTETLVAPYLINNNRPYSYPEDIALSGGKLNVRIMFCGVPKLNVIPPGSTRTNAFLFSYYAHIYFGGSGFGGGGLALDIQEIDWPTESGTSVSYKGCSGADDVTYGSLDSLEEFEQLNAKYGSSTPGTITIWVVNSINFVGGDVAGFSPAPGVPYIYGTSASALAIQSPADDLSLATFPEWYLMAVAMGHEVGHYLGLHHTTGVDGSPDGITQTDFLALTPYCSSVVWIPPFGDSCPDRGNLMFPFLPPGLTGVTITADQRSFAHSSPLVY